MDRKSIISGYSAYLPFADDSSQLILNLKHGKRVSLLPWFKSDEVAIKCGLSSNILIAKLGHLNDSAFDLLYRLIDEALLQATLDAHYLKGENVRVYLTGIGPRVDGMEYKSFYNYNDIEDITITSSVTNLCVANMSQDNIACNLTKKYGLRYLPPNMNCTSNSALTAIHLSSQAIEQGGIDLALIINVSKIKSQDLWFLSTQSMLNTDVVQPFGVNSKGVMFAEGCSVMLLESAEHRQARNLNGGISIKSAYKQINASRGNDASWQSTSILKLINKVLNDTGTKVEDLCAIIPHGNGSAFSDDIEAKAINLLAGEHPLPVLAYKGQIGYTATGSGLIDLIIGYHSLVHQELILPVGNGPVTEDMVRHVLLGPGVTPHNKKHLLKTGLGVDGSIIAMMMTDTSREE